MATILVIYREISFTEIFEVVMFRNRQNELELYKLLVCDEALKSAMQQSLKRNARILGI